jgi:hypothetical protein
MPSLTAQVLFFLIIAHHKKTHVATAMLTFSDFTIIKHFRHDTGLITLNKNCAYEEIFYYGYEFCYFKKLLPSESYFASAGS